RCVGGCCECGDDTWRSRTSGCGAAACGTAESRRPRSETGSAPLTKPPTVSRLCGTSFLQASEVNVKRSRVAFAFGRNNHSWGPPSGGFLPIRLKPDPTCEWPDFFNPADAASHV